MNSQILDRSENDPVKLDYAGSSGSLSWRLLCGDSTSRLRELQKESIDCCVTSPPYFWLRDYGIEGQIGLEDSIEEYVANLAETFDEVYRVLKPTGTAFLNLGDTYYSGKGRSHGNDPKSSKRRFGLRAVDKSGGMGIDLQKKSLMGMPWRVAIELCKRKWVLRSDIIWHRDRCLPEAVIDRPRRSYEHVFMLSKSRHYFFDRSPLINKDVDEDVWTIAPRPKGVTADTAPFPDELVERCIEIGCPEGGSVLDPFVGSGTTLLVGLRLQRDVVGIELNSELCHGIVREIGTSFGDTLCI